MIKALTGSGAAAYAMKQINPDVVPVYPITPQTEIGEQYSKYIADNLVDSEMIYVESEHSAMSACVGASAAGARTMTATSSQGFALMWEILSIASGLRLPIVMHVVNRALSGPINIHCDHSDSMGGRDLGWIQLYSENAQEVYDNTILAQKLAETAKLPVMIMQDGFVTSHALQEVNILDDKKVSSFIGNFKKEFPLLDVDKPVTYGPLQLQNYFFETKKQQAEAIKKSKSLYIKIGSSLSKLTKRQHNLFEEYKLKDANAAIVTLNSTAGTAKEVVDDLRAKGKKVGLLKLKLFRPFPYEEVASALKHIKFIATLDRSESFGANPPIHTEIKNALFNLNTKQKVFSCIFGLGGRDIYESDIENLFNELLKGKIKTNYIGLRG